MAASYEMRRTIERLTKQAINLYAAGHHEAGARVEAELLMLKHRAVAEGALRANHTKRSLIERALSREVSGG